VVPEKQGLKLVLVLFCFINVSCLSSGSRKTRIETWEMKSETAQERVV